MLEFLKRKTENPATIARKLEEQKQSVVLRVEELKAHIINGNGTPEDGRLLTELEEQLSSDPTQAA